MRVAFLRPPSAISRICLGQTKRDKVSHLVTDQPRRLMLSVLNSAILRFEFSDKGAVNYESFLQFFAIMSARGEDVARFRGKIEKSMT